MSEEPWSYSRVAAIRACDEARRVLSPIEQRTHLSIIERAITEDEPLDARVFADDLAHEPLAAAVAAWYASFEDLGGRA